MTVIVRDIVPSLPSFKPPSTRGKELLDVILVQLRASLKSDRQIGGEHVSLNGSRPYLDLALFLVVDKHLAHASHLLRFYYASLTPRPILSRFVEEDQAYVIDGLARALSTFEDVRTRAPPTAPAADLDKNPAHVSDDADDIALRRQFPDICAVLLHVRDLVMCYFL